jgi:hypothetical protein
MPAREYVVADVTQFDELIRPDSVPLKGSPKPIGVMASERVDSQERLSDAGPNTLGDIPNPSWRRHGHSAPFPISIRPSKHITTAQSRAN